MSSSFSERFGYKPKREFLQVESIDPPLKNALWNAFYTAIWEKLPEEYPFMGGGAILINWSRLFIRDMQIGFFEKPVDEANYNAEDSFARIKRFFFQAQWHEVYDFLEFVLGTSSAGYSYAYPDYVEQFSSKLNEALEKYLSAYRLLGNKFVSIVDDSEIEAIDTATAFKDYPAQHLSMAIEKLADRQNPDYRNSIKESISGVEAICREITNESTLDRALKKIQTKIEMNEQFKQGLEKLYHYTNAESGVRHALMEDTRASFDEAKFMLVTCSAFVNYLRAKSPKIEE